MENPEKVATLVTQHKEKQNKNTTQYVLDTTISKDEPNIVFYAEIVTDITTCNSEHCTLLKFSH